MALLRDERVLTKADEERSTHNTLPRIPRSDESSDSSWSSQKGSQKCVGDARSYSKGVIASGTLMASTACSFLEDKAGIRLVSSIGSFTYLGQNPESKLAAVPCSIKYKSTRHIQNAFLVSTLLFSLATARFATKLAAHRHTGSIFFSMACITVVLSICGFKGATVEVEFLVVFPMTLSLIQALLGVTDIISWGKHRNACRHGEGWKSQQTRREECGTMNQLDVEAYEDNGSCLRDKSFVFGG